MSRSIAARRAALFVSAARLFCATAVCAMTVCATVLCCTTGCDGNNPFVTRKPAPSAQPVGNTPAPGPAVATAPALTAASALTADQSAMVAGLARWQSASSEQRLALGELLGKRITGFVFVRLESFSCGGRQNEMAVFEQERSALEFVLIPGGSFSMGSPESEPGRRSDETSHNVRLTKGFLASRTEITQRAYSEVVGDDPSQFKSADNPVETVTYSQAAKFARRLLCELPTEAQWEYLCRAGSSDPFTFGSNGDTLGEYAWYDANAGRTTHGVGLKKPNAFGLFDVHGNVFEWTRDNETQYASGAVTDPETDNKGVHKMTRGGACVSLPPAVRCAQRFPSHGSDKNFTLGFRVVKTLDLD